MIFCPSISPARTHSASGNTSRLWDSSDATCTVRSCQPGLQSRRKRASCWSCACLRKWEGSVASIPTRTPSGIWKTETISNQFRRFLLAQVRANAPGAFGCLPGGTWWRWWRMQLCRCHLPAAPGRPWPRLCGSVICCGWHAPEDTRISWLFSLSSRRHPQQAPATFCVKRQKFVLTSVQVDVRIVQAWTTTHKICVSAKQVSEVTDVCITRLYLLSNILHHERIGNGA